MQRSSLSLSYLRGKVSSFFSPHRGSVCVMYYFLLWSGGIRVWKSIIDTFHSKAGCSNTSDFWGSRAELCDLSMPYLFVAQISGEFTDFVLSKAALWRRWREGPCVYLMSTLLYVFFILWLTVQGTSVSGVTYFWWWWSAKPPGTLCFVFQNWSTNSV